MFILLQKAWYSWLLGTFLFNQATRLLNRYCTWRFGNHLIMWISTPFLKRNLYNDGQLLYIKKAMNTKPFRIRVTKLLHESFWIPSSQPLNLYLCLWLSLKPVVYLPIDTTFSNPGFGWIFTLLLRIALRLTAETGLTMGMVETEMVGCVGGDVTVRTSLLTLGRTKMFELDVVVAGSTLKFSDGDVPSWAWVVTSWGENAIWEGVVAVKMVGDANEQRGGDGEEMVLLRSNGWEE